jgi:hypothetical protein
MEEQQKLSTKRGQLDSHSWRTLGLQFILCKKAATDSWTFS